MVKQINALKTDVVLKEDEALVFYETDGHWLTLRGKKISLNFSNKGNDPFIFSKERIEVYEEPLPSQGEDVNAPRPVQWMSLEDACIDMCTDIGGWYLAVIPIIEGNPNYDSATVYDAEGTFTPSDFFFHTGSDGDFSIRESRTSKGKFYII